MKYGADRNKGRQSSGRGYFHVATKDHPFADARGRVGEHRIVKERELGRVLDPSKEWVHHKDGIKGNNQASNLEVMSPQSHLRLHAGWKQIDGKWFKPCGACKGFFEVNESNFYRHNTGHNEFYSRCIPCIREDCKNRARLDRIRKKALR